ncbi:MAG: hypothetical protein HFE62_00270 [Firmicutes bacterium]|nr:hypothetical protein [Bacillota bacterium]
MTAKNKRPIPEDFLLSIKDVKTEENSQKRRERRTIHKQSKGLGVYPAMAAAILADMLKGN